MNNDIITTVKRDYTKKINGRFEGVLSEDINEFISLINYCFLNKNNFFVENFNKKNTKNIYLCYNQMKTNILDSNNKDLFHKIDKENLKSVKFILTNFVGKYDKIVENEPIVEEFCSKQGMKRFIEYINQKS